MEIQLTENKNFNNLTPRQKNFLLDSAEETFRKSGTSLREGDMLNLNKIFSENKYFVTMIKD
jgi:hypothetical protein